MALVSAIGGRDNDAARSDSWTIQRGLPDRSPTAINPNILLASVVSAGIYP
jgi:hypothetical protein